jgi:hypothetical protein
MTCLEAGHPLVVVAAGVRGIAPVRAALSWTPVLAHAGSSRVAVFYLADSPPSAAYLAEWDDWREAGVSRRCVWVPGGGRGAGSAVFKQQAQAQRRLVSWRQAKRACCLSQRDFSLRVRVWPVAEKARHGSRVFDPPLPGPAPLQASLTPLYLADGGGSSNGGGSPGAEQLLDGSLFRGPGGLQGLLGGAKPADAAVLLSGLEGELAASLTRKLTQHGFSSERVMVCEY